MCVHSLVTGSYQSPVVVKLIKYGWLFSWLPTTTSTAAVTKKIPSGWPHGLIRDWKHQHGLNKWMHIWSSRNIATYLVIWNFCCRNSWEFCWCFSTLTFKWLGHLFLKCNFTFWCCSPYVQNFHMKLVQNNEYLVSIVDTDYLVL